MAIQIAGRTIGLGHEPFIIAELSANHNGSLDRALRTIDAAAEAGADAVKLQTYTPDSITLNVDAPDFVIADPSSLWCGRRLYDLYAEAQTPREWHEALFRRARDRGLIVFSTAFDEDTVDFLESLDVPCHKIASFENTHLPLIAKMAATGKPLIVSAGMATMHELCEAVDTARNSGCKEIAILKCTSAYPAPVEQANLATIPHIREVFGVEVGLSDHTEGIVASIASVILGGTIIEKHFTLDRAEGGVDSAFSLEPSELASLVVDVERAWSAVGSVTYGPTTRERESLRFRRSIYVSADLEAGERLTDVNIRVVRPGFGLEPKYYDVVLGRRAGSRIERGTPLSWELLD